MEVTTRRTRSALARHRKRRLLESTLHVSDTLDLSAIAEIAGAVSLTRLAEQLRAEGDAVGVAANTGILSQAIRVLRNVKNSIYHRAMAARALGLLMLEEPALIARLGLESEDLLDALLQLVNCSRRFETQNADTRRVHVNCCLVISMLMRATPQQQSTTVHQRLQLVVALDSELLTMPPRPTDPSSVFLLLTMNGRPETSVDDLPVERMFPLEPVISRKHAKVDPTRLHWPLQVSQSITKTVVRSPFSPADKSQTMGAPSKPIVRDEDAGLASVIERQQTPSRQFKMERFRVITPALVPSTALQRARDKLLPVILPSRHQLQPDEIESHPPGSRNQMESSPRPGQETEALAIPSSPRTPPPTSASLLKGDHMVEILRTGRMPVASLEYFNGRLRDEQDSRRASPSRLPVVEWGEWCRGGASATPSLELSSTLDVEQTPIWPRRSQPAGTSCQVPSSIISRSAHPIVEDIYTPEHKRERLRDILSSPIEPLERNTAHLHSLHQRENTTTMAALEVELISLRRAEARTRHRMCTLIEQERDKLPLKFLFQLPGGARYCRDRMRKAMMLWVLEFEANQKRMALLQWKACVEQCRFRLRGRAYHRQAIEKRLKVAIEYVLRGYQQQAFKKWIETVQLAIWTARDGAARKIQRQVRRRFGLLRFLRWQKQFPVGGPFLRDIFLSSPCDDSSVCRFHIPRRVREERRRIWFCAELVQGVYRMRRFRRFLKRYRIAATTIQTRGRMRIQRGRYRLLKKRIIQFQAWVRMQHHFRVYQTLRNATILVQVNFRSMRTRRMRQLVVKARQRALEWRLTSALLLQRIARGFLGRCDARRRRREQEEMFHAALVMQRAWYRRNNEWSTFLLLGCLREKEIEEVAFDQRVLQYKKTHMAKRIQRAWLRHWHQLRTRAAAFAQRNVRRWLATRCVELMRRQEIARRRIKWFLRVRLTVRAQTATRLQFWWMRAVPGRLAAHLRHERVRAEAVARRTQYTREQAAATTIQSADRGRRARLVALKERSVRVIQRAARAFVDLRRVKHEIRRTKAAFAAQQAQLWISTVVDMVFASKMARLSAAAVQIQRFARGSMGRSKLMQLLVASELSERMARRIQSLWRRNAQTRLAKRVLGAQQRRRGNPFRAMDSISYVLRKIVERTSALYDPRDELRGLHVAAWLKRLGLDEERYAPLFLKLGEDAIAQLRLCGDAGSSLRMLEQMGVRDDNDAQLMAKNLFAAQTLRDVRQLRVKLEQLCRTHREEEKRAEFIQRQLHDVQRAKADAAEELDELLTEAAEFRNPPKALRAKRVKLSVQLEKAQQKENAVNRKHDTVQMRSKQRKRDISALQSELSQRDKDEVSALFTLQNFRLVQNLSLARELFLSKFSGLETRALSFVGALEEGQVSTWQLLRFFESNATVAQVKAAMARLTYFKFAADVKKHDHARFQACADIAQFGFERIGEILNIPLDDMVMAGRPDEGVSACAVLPALVLKTVYDVQSVRKPRERAIMWTDRAQALARMSAVATRVQSLWRRRVANRVMLMLRTTRLKLKLRDEYLAEVRADYVTPIWQDERDRERHEFEIWKKEEARATKEEALYAIVRYPWHEVWDESSQSWVVCRAGNHYADEMEPQYVYADERPVYSVEEEDAIVRIQALARRFLARLELRERRRLRLRKEKRLRMERQWLSKAAERAQNMTLRLAIGAKADARVSLWIGHRQQEQLKNQKSKKNDSLASTKPNAPPVRSRRNAVDKEHEQKRKLLEAETVRAFELQLTKGAALQLCDASYHRSVRTEHRRHVLFPATARPSNAHAHAMLDLVTATQTLEGALAAQAHATTTLKFTRVVLPFGWREVSPVGGTNNYFVNSATSETSWERPQHTFAHDFAANKIQSLARVALAQLERARRRHAISFVQSVHAALQRAASIGWVGFGLEGLSASVFLSRLGLAKYNTALASLSVDELLQLSECKMKRLGWTKEEMATLRASAPPRQPRRKAPLTSWQLTLSPTTKHAFNFLPTERAVEQIVAQSLPNQQGRVVGLVRAIVQSTTPISYRQLEMHLRLYAGRPDDAVAHIGDIASLAYATQAPEEKQILALYLRCVERCVAFAANLGLRALREELTEALHVAAALLETPRQANYNHGYVVTATHSDSEPLKRTNDTAPLLAAGVLLSPATPLAASSRDIASLADAARRQCLAAPTKGLWEHDVQSPSSAPSVCSAAQVALFLREQALERTLLWWRSAAVTQATFRMHRVRDWYRSVVAHRYRSVVTIQSAWRWYCALEMRRLLESQQCSPYEQRFDIVNKSFFFVYTPTSETLLEEPRDATGSMLPFRPMVQDRVTKRWLLAWPHLAHKGRMRTPSHRGDGDGNDYHWELDAARCSVCYAERAVRRCNECYSTSGDYVDFCLACFYDRHDPHGELAWHSFAPLHRTATRAFHCVECKRLSTRRCLVCREHYCERCFLRVHRKGHTRARHTCEHYAPLAAVCVECEAHVAFQKCLVCLDALCEACMVRTHARGAKQSHELKLLKQPLAEGHIYCEQCHARRGDTACSFCAMALCQLCLLDPAKHGVACPETQLQLKKKELLGDRLCVECGKPADRACVSCGDKYCSVKWMGNAGCFERFHWKGKRADHTCAPLCNASAEMPREILELEQKVKQKRRRDAEAAAQDAKAMAAALVAAADAEQMQAKPKAAPRKVKRRRTSVGASKRRLLGSAAARLVCAVEQCGQPTLSAAVPFCGRHLTPQHALEVTKEDPFEAAKLLALLEKHGGKLPAARGRGRASGSGSGGFWKWKADKSGDDTAPGAGDSVAVAPTAAPKPAKSATIKTKKPREKTNGDAAV